MPELIGKTEEELEDLVDAVDANYNVWKKDVEGTIWYCYIRKLQVPEDSKMQYTAWCVTADGSKICNGLNFETEPTEKEVEDSFFA